MNKRPQCIPPEGARELSLIEDGGDPFIKNAIGTFCNSILLRSRSSGVFPGDSMHFEKVIHLLAHVFAPFIVPECLDCVASLLFSKCLKLLECSKCIRFLVE